MKAAFHPAELRTLYTETRQTEKRVAVARLELQYHLEQTRQQLAQMAERKVQAIRALEKEALDEL